MYRAWQKAKGEIMKYLVLTGTVINKQSCRAGDVVDVPDDEVKTLKAMGRIAEYVEKKVESQDRSVGLSDETKPRRRTRKKVD